MAGGAISATLRGDGSRVRIRWPLPAKSLFAFSWLSIFFDEVHEARTGQKLWQSMDLACNVAMVKVFATATPYVEGPRVRLLPHRGYAD